ncbi:LLM class flavin-dependent oxidoreductase [Microbacterium sp.]|uniref:LLM class flavin-dependent oxidoreductase n=1 Tax=Microbacterium sp. TaxID=51671 RepID=UPI002811BDC8|nr:TIGR03619 family F420-dependent LLM class oxidoreductase [Microbacterium sp.]
MRIGVALPQSSAGEPGFAGFTERFACRAEELGLDSLWVQEQLLGVDSSIEPLINLAFVSAVTRRVRLGTAAVIAPARNPIVLAKQLGSLDRLSEGRLIAGFGIGDMPQLFDASGVDHRHRGQRLDAMLDLMTALWSSEPVHYADTERQLDGARMSPSTLQRPHPPLWFGGASPGALARAARRGSGWVGAGGSSPASFARAARRLRQLGADRDGFTIAKKVYLAVEDDTGRARSRIVDWFAAHWGTIREPQELAAEVAVFGNPQQCAAALDELVAAGRPDLLILNPVYDEADQLESVVAEVLPRMRAVIEPGGMTRAET